MKDINTLKFEEISHEFYIQGQELSKAKANLEYIKKNEKSILATQASKSDGKNEAGRTRFAYKSPEYQTWKDGYKEAVQKEAVLNHYLSALEMKFKYEQSVNALNRVKAGIT